MRPKSTGWRSQNNHFWAHCRDIAEQLSYDQYMVTAREVAEALLLDASDDGWPTRVIGRRRVAMSWSQANSEQANLGIDTAHRFADEHGLSLTEYIGGEAMKVLYGGSV